MSEADQFLGHLAPPNLCLQSHHTAATQSTLSITSPRSFVKVHKFDWPTELATDTQWASNEATEVSDIRAIAVGT
jgi:hypothetical protein